MNAIAWSSANKARLVAWLAVCALFASSTGVWAQPLALTNNGAPVTFSPTAGLYQPTIPGNAATATGTATTMGTTYNITEYVFKDPANSSLIDFVYKVTTAPGQTLGGVNLDGFNTAPTSAFYDQNNTSATPGVSYFASQTTGFTSQLTNLQFDFNKSYTNFSNGGAGTYLFGVQVAAGGYTAGSSGNFSLTGSGITGSTSYSGTLLVPTPEPSSMAIAAIMGTCGAGAFGWRRWRSRTSVPSLQTA